MRTKHFIGLLALLAVILSGCGIIAPDAKLEVYQGDKAVSTAQLSPSEQESVLEVVNTGQMRAYFDVRIQGEWAKLEKKPTASFLDPEEHAAFTIGYNCEIPGTYTGSVIVNYEKQIGRWSSFTTPIVLECPAQEPSQLSVQRDGYTITGLLELYVDDGQSGSVELELVNIGDEDLQFLIEKPLATWIWKHDRIYGSSELSSGEKQSLILNYQCEETPPADTVLTITVLNGVDLKLPVTLTGCAELTESQPDKDLAFVFDDVVVESLTFEVGEGGSGIVKLQNSGPETISTTITSSNPVLALTSPITGARSIEPGSSIDIPFAFTCGSTPGPYDTVIEANYGAGSVSLAIALTGCETPAAVNPVTELMFLHQGGELTTNTISFNVDDSPTVVLKNNGDATFAFELMSSDNNRLIIDDTALYGRHLANDASLDIPLSFACDGETDSFNETIRVMADGSEVKALTVKITGCTEEPEANLEEDLKFYYLSGGEIKNTLQVGVRDITTVSLQNNGDLGIAFELIATPADTVFIGEGALGGRNLDAGTSLEVPLSFVCSDETDEFEGEVTVMVDGQATSVELALNVTGCMKPEDALVFKYGDANDVGEVSVDYSVGGTSFRVDLHNIGPTDLTVSLESTNVFAPIYPEVDGTYTIEAGGSIPVELALTCDGNDASYSTTIHAKVDGNTEKSLKVNVTECELEDEELSDDELVGFINSDNQPISGLRLADALSGTVEVGLKNSGSRDVTYELNSTADWLTINTTVMGESTVFGESTLTVPIEYSCPTGGTPSAAIVATFGDGTSIQLPVVLAGCDLAPEDSIRVLINGTQATAVYIDKQAVEDEPGSFTITLDNVGQNDVRALVELLNLSHERWIWPADFSSGDIILVKGTSELRTLEFKCDADSNDHTAELKISFPDSGSSVPITMPIKLVGCP